MKVKMIIERVMKALLKRNLIYSFELICIHGLVFGIPSLSMFLLRRLEYLFFGWTYQIFVFEKMFLFSSRYMF